MNGLAKDSSEVIKFMALFARLKDWVDDSPAHLTDMAETDPGVGSLCTQLFSAAFDLKIDERRGRSLFFAPVDPAFVAAWRDYEERYEPVVSSIWASDFFPEVNAGEQPLTPKADLQWGNADKAASEQAEGIEEAIRFSQFNVEQEDRWVDHPTFVESVHEGIAAWEGLKQETGFDIRGVFRRRALIPFVLVPRHVAAKYGNAQTLSMLKNLQQAHDAFVFGATYAALALMRSITEALLRDHYWADGKDLEERIRNSRHKLPRGANEAALHRLRKLANAILHLNPEKDMGLAAMDEVQLEKEIVSLLFVLRSLIEGAK